jgi:hypothetical protein
MRPFPGSPIGFSALSERVRADDGRGTDPRFMPRPLKESMAPFLSCGRRPKGAPDCLCRPDVGRDAQRPLPAAYQRKKR